MLPVLTPTDFVALANQTFEFAYPSVEIEGELLNFKVSRGKWVYFDIADEFSKIRCFGTVYMLPGPLEDGMKIRLTASPRLHQQFGFSLNLKSIQLSGEGTIKKAADLLFAKLEKEGLFAPERKRQLPFPPERIGLITSEESAGYKDFTKVLAARYGGLNIELANVQVQGEAAVGQIVRAIEWFNKQADIVDVLVVVRGGGSADDLQAFSSEQVARAIAASRVPTLVAIGHEVDTSLAELAADQRASTPSNAAELLVPDRRELLAQMDTLLRQLHSVALESVQDLGEHTSRQVQQLHDKVERLVRDRMQVVTHQLRTLHALSPQAVLKRGYALVSKEGQLITSASRLKKNDILNIKLADGQVKTKVQ